MSGFEFRSAGESHGPQLTGIVEGLPAGLPIDFDRLAAVMAARQGGFGRGGRMKIERDECQITAGVRHGLTLGSPLGYVITNRDWKNWQSVMSLTADRPEPGSEREASLDAPRTVPRPGHADLPGAQKSNFHDLRNVLERASARETATRVAAGAFAQMLLAEFGVDTASHVVRIGEASLAPGERSTAEIRRQIADSDVRCVDSETSDAMRAVIRKAAASSDTVGGVVEIVVSGVVPGLGDHTQWHRKLDGRLAQALISVPSIKGFEIGAGFTQASAPGSQVHDPIYYHADAGDRQTGFYRKTNRAGGLEGGLTNGADIVVRAAAKPISTLNAPLDSVDIHSKNAEKAFVERSDICCVPAAAVVCEAMVAIVLADAYLQMFGEGALSDLKTRFESYCARLDQFGG